MLGDLDKRLERIASWEDNETRKPSPQTGIRREDYDTLNPMSPN
jgi:hypothetical protein